MDFTIDDLYKKADLHCWDCRKDVAATLLPKPGGTKVEVQDRKDNEMHVDINMPIHFQCPICNGYNVGGVQMSFTVDKNKELVK